MAAITSRFILRAADKSEIDWVAAQEAEVYSREDAIPADILQEWFATNPDGFNIIEDLHTVRVGHLTLLPLKPKSLQLLLGGRIREREVKGDGIYPGAERSSVSCLWIESITIGVSSRHLRARALLHVFAGARRAIERVSNPLSLTQFYALSATRAGDNLLKRFGFQVTSLRSQRADDHDLYCASYHVIRRKTEELTRSEVGRGQ